MEAVHAFPEIEPVGILSQKVAVNFNLHTPLLLRGNAGLVKHFLAQAFSPALRSDCKLHYFCNASGVVKLVFKPQVQNRG